MSRYAVINEQTGRVHSFLQWGDEHTVIGDDYPVEAGCRLLELNESTFIQAEDGFLRTPGGLKLKNASAVAYDEMFEELAKPVEVARSEKKAELNAICSSLITEGFVYAVEGVDYRFHYDTEAQSNFRESRDILASGFVTEVPFTAYRVDTGERVRLKLNRVNLAEMQVVQFQHRDSLVEKYNDLLLNKVNKAKTADEVEAIKWE